MYTTKLVVWDCNLFGNDPAVVAWLAKASIFHSINSAFSANSESNPIEYGASIVFSNSRKVFMSQIPIAMKMPDLSNQVNDACLNVSC